MIKLLMKYDIKKMTQILIYFYKNKVAPQKPRGEREKDERDYFSRRQRY